MTALVEQKQSKLENHHVTVLDPKLGPTHSKAPYQQGLRSGHKFKCFYVDQAANKMGGYHVRKKFTKTETKKKYFISTLMLLY